MVTDNTDIFSIPYITCDMYYTVKSDAMNSKSFFKGSIVYLHNVLDFTAGIIYDSSIYFLTHNFNSSIDFSLETQRYWLI